MFGLYLDNDGRIVGAVLASLAFPDAVIVDNLPDGEISDYLYRDGEYIYSPTMSPDGDPNAVEDPAGNKYRQEIRTDGSIHLVLVESFTGELFE